MKSVQVSTLLPGTLAQSDYFTEKGELLLSKGVPITEQFLDAFKRRNIFDVFIRPASEEEELTSMLTREFKSMGDVDIDDQSIVQKIQDVRRIKPGKEGLQQLNRSEKACLLDRQLGSTPDRPIGPALKNKSTVRTVVERTDQYKANIADSYTGAIKDVRYILDTLATGGSVDGKEIRRIVDNFVGIFITDRNILLNISGIKHTTEDYIYHHSLNVCLLSINIAASSGYNENQVVEIGMGALLHDIGMLLIPTEIRTKQGRLTQEEWFEIQKHPVLGLHVLEKVSRLPEAIPYVAYQVHERENSTGYPKRRNSLLIHRFAKLAQVADIFEAITSPRSHRPPSIPHEGAVRLIKMSKAGMIPGEFVKAFLEYVSLYPVGSLVQLNDNRIAKVIHANRTSLGKPEVSILTDCAGTLVAKSEIRQLDLSTCPGAQITRALPSTYLAAVDIMDGF